ncbi:hypothetical protein FBQ82_07210 [Anaerolineae bacterium CFX7]|nr:hypothetical protein [Anaerolineae bacterium CFX7]
MNDLPSDTPSDIVESPEVPESMDGGDTTVMEQSPEIPEVVDSGADAVSSDPAADAMYVLGTIRAGESDARDLPTPHGRPMGESPETPTSPDTQPLDDPSTRIRGDKEPPPGWTPGGPER